MIMNKISFTILFAILALLPSCTTETETVEDEVCIYELSINATFKDYSDTPTTRAAMTWSMGDELYLYFRDGSKTTTGTAVYDGSKWTLETSASLSNNSSGDYNVFYFRDAKSTSSTSVSLDASSAIYEGSGTWKREAGCLTIHMSLSPTQARMRFKGSSGTTFSLSGISYYTEFNKSTGNFTTSTSSISSSILQSGYSPYIYGRFESPSSPSLTILSNGITYTMSCPSTMFQPGKSGRLTLPAESDHNGWTSSKSTDIDASGSDYDEDHCWDQAGEGAHEAVDLGLSVKWATMNVGATEVAGTKINSHTGQLDCYGEYFAWGETTPKESYDWSTLKYCSGTTYAGPFTKYVATDFYGTNFYGTVDGETTLDLSDDAARVNWGGSWRMPTSDEQTELLDNCYWEWTSSYNNSDVKGYIIYKVKNSIDKGIKKHNGSSTTTSVSYSLSDAHIFLPGAGRRNGGLLYETASWGYYWSSSLYESLSDCVRDLYFYSNDVDGGYNGRCSGYSVRPVCP